MKSKYKLSKKIFIVIFWGIIATCYFGSALYLRFKYQGIYNEGVSLLESGRYVEAIKCFNEIPDCRNYKDIGVLLKDYPSICPYCGSVME